MEQKYKLSNFHWYYVIKSKKLIPFKIGEKSIENFEDKSIIEFNQYNDIKEIMSKKFDKGEIFSDQEIIENFLNVKEKNKYGASPEQYGWNYCVFNSKEIAKISKFFQRKINQKFEEFKNSFEQVNCL